MPNKRVRLTAAQTLARMRAGDCPTQSGSGGWAGIFDDGAVTPGAIMRMLLKTGMVEFPTTMTSVYSRYRLPKGGLDASR